MSFAKRALAVLNSITPEQYAWTNWWDEVVMSLEGYDDSQTILADLDGRSDMVVFRDRSKAVLDGEKWVAIDTDERQKPEDRFASKLGFVGYEELLKYSETVVHEKNDVSWYITHLQDGRWASWDDSEISEDRVAIFGSKEEALENIRAGLLAAGYTLEADAVVEHYLKSGPRYYLRGELVMAVAEDGNSYSLASQEDPEWDGYVGSPWRSYDPSNWQEITEAEAHRFLGLD